jgi:hypothetical protein
MNAYLLYHQAVHTSRLPCGIAVYHDHPRDNQDPYIWNKQFLHTYCHMKALRKETPEFLEGDLRFWVSAGEGVARKGYAALLCDLVFVVKDQHSWSNLSDLKVKDDPRTDSPEEITTETYEDHYKPGASDHPLPEGEEYVTVKAHPYDSFQPLNEQQQRYDIFSFLKKKVDTAALWKAINFTPRSSYPFPLDPDVAGLLYERLKKAPCKRTGEELQPLRRQYPELLGSDPKWRRPSRRKKVFEKSMACSFCPWYHEC